MRRLQLILVSLLLIVFLLIISRGRREGFDTSCPPGETNIGNSTTCGKPGSTLRNSYRGDTNPTCKPGFTYIGGAGECGRNQNGQWKTEFGNMICPSGTEAAVFSYISQGRDESGKPISAKTEKCFYPCPSGTVAYGAGCVPSGPPASSTTTASGAGSGTSTTSGSGTGSGSSTTSGTSSSATTCNVERYSNYKRSGPQELAPF